MFGGWLEEGLVDVGHLALWLEDVGGVVVYEVGGEVDGHEGVTGEEEVEQPWDVWVRSEYILFYTKKYFESNLVC